MTGFRFSLKSIFFYWKVNVASLLATALCVAIITGALIIGDSMKFSLEQITKQRLGETAYVMQSGDKPVRKQLARDLATRLQVKAAPLLLLEGVASADDGKKSANQVMINGMDSTFWDFSNTDRKLASLQEDEIYLNTKLAEQLKVQADDFVLLKIRKHDDVPLNSPFISTERRFVSLYAQVKGILSDNEFGRFSLRNDQVSPYNVFIGIGQLNDLIGQKQLANVILIGKKENISLTLLADALEKTWIPEDASISFRKTGNMGQMELLSKQIFIDKTIVDAAHSSFNNIDPAFTYLVNSIENSGLSTPYSFVSSLQSLDLREHEIIMNQWLADDLNAKPGDTLTLRYYTVGPLRRLDEKTKSFVVKDIVRMKGVAADESLMPAFPGMAEVKNCRDWNVGVNIDLEKIRDKDEKYWDDYRGTPKAFIAFETAREIWQNDFGQATSIRFSCNSKNIDSLQQVLLKHLNPIELGLQFVPVQQQGLQAAGNAVDFSQLFLGMSFFIVVSALLLIGLFFYLNNEYRNREMGLYLAIGFQKKHIRKIYLQEGFIIIVLGSFMGLALAIGYNKILLKAVNTIWIEMVKTNILFVKINPGTLAIGWIAGAFSAFFTLYFSLRGKLRRSIVGIQKETGTARAKGHFNRISLLAGLTGLSVTLIVHMFSAAPNSSMLFFIYGMLLLVTGLAGFDLMLAGNRGNLRSYNINLFGLSFSNLARNRRRSLLTVAMLAIGVFLVISTGANRQYLNIDAEDTASGTGGYLYFAETTMPVIEDLNIPENKVKYGLENTDTLGIDIFQMKMLEGDEASCFNLNQIQKPRLLGLDYHKLSGQNAFSFAKVMEGYPDGSTWKLLGKDLGDGTYPVIADQTVIKWSFMKNLGDTLFFQDEKGDTVNLVLVAGLRNSIFQGNLLISDSVFRILYPTVAGSKRFLIEGNTGHKETIRELFNSQFRDYGMHLTPTGERLASFYSVQDTYLNVFILLGGIGLIIGTLGIGILIFRSVLEREKELAILRAVGYNKSLTKKILLTENAVLLFAGITIGSASAIISTLPSFLEAGGHVPVMLILGNMLALAMFGGLVVYFAVTVSFRKNLVAVLKTE